MSTMTSITPPMREALTDKAVWTITDVCAFFDISDDSLKRWRDRDAFPSPRVMPGGKSLRWDVVEVLSWWDLLERAA